jgi:hypothetical protein
VELLFPEAGERAQAQALVDVYANWVPQTTFYERISDCLQIV